MHAAVRPKQQELIDSLPDPRADEEWFQDLPDERRESMTQEWRDGLARTAALQNRHWLQSLVSVLRIAAIFAIGDFVCFGGFLSLITGLLPGVVVGVALEALRAGRILCILVGMSSFPLWLLLSRGYWNPWWFFFVVIVGSAFALEGWRREETA